MQSQKNCPIGTLYRPCERQEGAICVSYAFLPASKKAFCFVAVVTIRRTSPDLSMALLETKCGCTHSDIVSKNV